MTAIQHRQPLVACLLLAVSLAAASTNAQQMSKEDQAIYDQMVKSAGLDPARVAKAQSDTNSSRR